MSALRGVCAAVLTPLDAQLRPDSEKAVPYYRWLLENGCDALNVLGTTGEAISIAADERVRFMEAIASSGLPLERMMVGTGAASLGDAVRLTSAAMQLGFGAALVMPPFFFRGVDDAGVMRFFELLLEAVHPRRNAIFLYNFPAMSGIAFHPELVAKLMQAYPGLIGGIKDSSNDTALQLEIAARYPDLLVYPSSEAALTDARGFGFAGCISGSVALWPHLASSVWCGESALQPPLSALRNALAGVNLIAAVRFLVARARNDLAWERCVPPLSPLSASDAERLAVALAAIQK